jgi:hypothetical protein
LIPSCSAFARIVSASGRALTVAIPGLLRVAVARNVANSRPNY